MLFPAACGEGSPHPISKFSSADLKFSKTLSLVASASKTLRQQAHRTYYCESSRGFVFKVSVLKLSAAMTGT